MRYESTVYRPPSESKSYILQCTVGCSHNGCTFCGMYKDTKYRVRSVAEIKHSIEMAKKEYGDLERVFLADGDALSLDCKDLLEIVRYLYHHFPNLSHVGIYAGPRTIINKTDDQLIALKEAGITIAYLGVETGDEQLLKEINKGVTRNEMIHAGRKIIQSGIKLSVTVLLGLAGKKERSLEHARATAEVCNAIDPDFLAALTLMVVPGTRIYDRVEEGTFNLLGPFEVISEMHTLIKNLDVTHCEFRSNHASNYLAIKGALPRDKERILAQLATILSDQDTRHLRPEFLRGI